MLLLRFLQVPSNKWTKSLIFQWYNLILWRVWILVPVMYFNSHNEIALAVDTVFWRKLSFLPPHPHSPLPIILHPSQKYRDSLWVSSLITKEFYTDFSKKNPCWTLNEIMVRDLIFNHWCFLPIKLPKIQISTRSIHLNQWHTRIARVVFLVANVPPLTNIKSIQRIGWPSVSDTYSDAITSHTFLQGSWDESGLITKIKRVDIQINHRGVT